MKKVLFITVILTILNGLNATAQIQKGNVMVGGNFTNINLGLNDPKVFSLDVTPKAAWFVQDNIALGAYVDLGIQTAKGSNTTVNYGLGALGRYYTGSDVEILKHGRLFGEGTIGLGGVNVSNGGGNTNGLDFSFGPGFAYFITPNIGLETLLKYNGLGGFGSQGYQSNLNLSFGFQIYLPARSTGNKIKNDVR
ncbi:hypothetical protein D0C36_04565 [Mucilaginibacter conchicola]|uniref:Outer membrane protein beta-barrel domain-containing protein n=1 Tax=Mucilaginibacter conchicola TaxID=2303333 RepID=A0A372NXP2_9SPHI|nr:hypothetical protein [Mucilaginibacter conchicola]RFZ94812.1 hypothetical protein D0C36_04565 [Mucilaginibacter conchicola]